jgi:hypothetical protein
MKLSIRAQTLMFWYGLAAVTFLASLGLYWLGSPRGAAVLAALAAVPAFVGTAVGSRGADTGNRRPD